MLKIYRKRYLPEEEMLWLRNDEILRADGDVVVTKWATLRPRVDFSHGTSCYFLHKNYKISKFFDHQDNFLFYYCDIIKTEILHEDYVFCDLLVDIVLYPDFSTKVLDLDELAVAFEKGQISAKDLKLALTATDDLLKIIYSGKFIEISAILDQMG